MDEPEFPVFDGHNDTLLRLVEGDTKGERDDFLEEGSGHIDLVKAREGGLCGGLFAIFAPGPRAGGGVTGSLPVKGEPIAFETAERYTGAMVDKAEEIVMRAEGAVRLCRSAAEIRAATEKDALALVLHIEGAEAIDPEFAALERLYARGLRSLGIVWSRRNAFGDGVPFTFPGSPDQGEGLSALGGELVRRCERLGIAIDLSHISEKGFWDVARLSDGPLIASHSNVHALCPSPRNLTDRQLDAIAERGGLVGLNFANGFLRADGDHRRTDTALETMIRHLDHLVARLGEDGVGLGSDFDGATMPEALGDARGLPRLTGAMIGAGFGPDLTRKIARDNWLSVLERVWGG